MNMDFKEGVNDEDDVFYGELRRQILLLTADDDEDFLNTRHVNSPSDAKKTSKRLTTSLTIATQPGRYFSCWESQHGSLVPAWLVDLWRNSNGGTGVFIPHIVKPRRRHRSGRKSRGRRKNMQSS